MADRKQRQKYHKFIAEGDKVVREALQAWPDRALSVIADPSRFDARDYALPPGCAWVDTDKATMEKISQVSTPPGILVVLRFPDTPQISAATMRLLYLDAIRDPGNLGTIIRTADWFGVHDLVLGPGTVEWANPKVVQAAMGSLFRVRLHAGSLEDYVSGPPPFIPVVADMEGAALESFRWPEKTCLVLGNESHGIRPDLRMSDVLKVTIPKRREGTAESLNVSIASGILLNAWTLQEIA